ncbi:hypothetical protein P8452_17512 [Trifolium repens]|nr:hypothetical protein P8452_17512 [Trifolium repens]
MKPLLNPLLFFIHSSLKRIRIRSAISFFVETQIDRVLQPCLVYLQQTDYLKHLCKVSVWKSEATEQVWLFYDRSVTLQFFEIALAYDIVGSSF